MLLWPGRWKCKVFRLSEVLVVGIGIASEKLFKPNRFTSALLSKIMKMVLSVFRVPHFQKFVKTTNIQSKDDMDSVSSFATTTHAL